MQAENIAVAEPPTLSPEEEIFIFPTSFAQQRLWFLDRLMPGHRLYVVDVAIHLEGNVEISALRWAVDALVARHESFRTTFVAVDGKPFARVNGSTKVAIEVDADPREFARRTFDLERGPLLRVCFIPEQSLLLVCIHHIVTDGWRCAFSYESYPRCIQRGVQVNLRFWRPYRFSTQILRCGRGRYCQSRA